MSDRPRHGALRRGIAEMDDDHARIDALLARAAGMEREGLPELLAAVRAELAAHFEREEALLRERRFPGLFCHLAQHRAILADVDRAAAARAISLPRLLEVVVPQLVHSHIATMDGMVASFLTGEIDAADFDGLRLPLPEAAQ